jgi:hypothetical protein
MKGMRDLGSFGDERLKKGGPIFWRLWFAGARFACGGLAGTGRVRFDFSGFCTIRR